MNQNTQKLWNFISSNKNIAEQLFFMSDINDFSIWLLNQNEKQITKIKWLFVTKVTEQATLIGVHENTVYSIDHERNFNSYIDGLENLPYEFLRREIEFGYPTLKDYFNQFPQKKQLLHQYEKWCHDNNIVLDQDNFYHHNGHLFEEYFD